MCVDTRTDRKSSLGDVKLAHVFSDTQEKLSSQQSGVQQEQQGKEGIKTARCHINHFVTNNVQVSQGKNHCMLIISVFLCASNWLNSD